MNTDMSLMPADPSILYGPGNYDPNDVRIFRPFGFRPWGFGFRPWGFGFRPWGFGFGAPFVGGLLGGLTAGALLGGPWGYGYGYGYPYFGYGYPFWY